MALGIMKESTEGARAQSTMDATIQEILSLEGYVVTTSLREKYRGAGSHQHVCIATKNSVTYYAFKVGTPDCVHDHADHYERIRTLQDSIPRMARMVGPFEDVVLLEAAHGQLLWDLDKAPDPAIVEAQLIEFALGTARNQLIHGDLRPWNVFFDSEHGVQVIDWWCLSSFVDDLLARGVLPARRADLLGQGHYAKFHPELVAGGKLTDIDQEDARRIGKLLRGDIGLSEAWQPVYRITPRPTWCKP
jgi:hypothetical protein